MARPTFVRRPAADGSAPRLLLVIGTLQGGGAERQLSDMANYWAARGVRVKLATWSGPELPDFYPLGPEIERVWLSEGALRTGWISQPGATLRRVLALRRLVRAYEPDAILSFIDISNVHTILATRRFPARVVVAERTYPEFNRTVGRAWRVLRRLLYSRADLVIAQTHAAAEWLERTCGARVTVIPNSLRELPVVDSKREHLIVAAGRLSSEKGIDVLLRAFAQVTLEFPGWRVCIIGDGVERDALLKLREQLQLTQVVDFVGEERRIDPWLARAALLVHASRREGFPNVVLEAMGMGVAVICADCRAGPSDLIEDGVNGRLVPVDDEGAMAQRMRELMADCRAREQLGSEAQKVRQRFHQDIVMQQWQSCLFPAIGS